MLENITLPRYAKAKDLCALLGVSKSAIHKYRKEGNFPQPIKIGNSLRWNMAHVQEWIDQQEQSHNQLHHEGE